MNTKKIIVTAVIIVVIGLVGGYFLMQGATQNTNVPQTNTSVNNSINNPEQSNTGNEQPADMQPQPEVKHEIVYTDAGYSPKELTIKVGETVTWKNQSSGAMWTASGIHPDHVVYSGTTLQQHCPDTANTAFDECKGAQPGESWSFTFTKAGTWSYHNHSRSTHFGKVIVQ